MKLKPTVNVTGDCYAATNDRKKSTLLFKMDFGKLLVMWYVFWSRMIPM